MTLYKSLKASYEHVACATCTNTNTPVHQHHYIYPPSTDLTLTSKTMNLTSVHDHSRC
jgi:hypothetical protein